MAGISGFVGRRDVAERLLGELLDYAKTAYVSKVKVAEVLFGLGRTDEAFDSLEEAYGEKSIFPGHFRVLPWFGEARKDIRWDALTKRIGLQ